MDNRVFTDNWRRRAAGRHRNAVARLGRSVYLGCITSTLFRVFQLSLRRGQPVCRYAPQTDEFGSMVALERSTKSSTAT